MVEAVLVDNSATAENLGELRWLVDVDYLLKSGYGLVQQECNRTAAGRCRGRCSGCGNLLHVPHHSATKVISSLQINQYRNPVCGIRC